MRPHRGALDPADKMVRLDARLSGLIDNALGGLISLGEDHPELHENSLVAGLLYAAFTAPSQPLLELMAAAYATLTPGGVPAVGDGAGVGGALPPWIPLSVAVRTAWECCGGEKPRGLNATNRATLGRWERGEGKRAAPSTLEALVGEALNRRPDEENRELRAALLRHLLELQGRS